MTLGELLISVWQQVLAEGAEVAELEDESYDVKYTRAKKLRMARFRWRSHYIDGIEQNLETSSRWALLARQGKRVMQFSYQRGYIANVCEGKLLRYPAWRVLQLAE